MTIREELEWTEHLCLSERAQFSDATRGRPRPEEAQETTAGMSARQRHVRAPWRRERLVRSSATSVAG